MANSESGSTINLRPRRKRDFLSQPPNPVVQPKPKKKKKTAVISLSLREILKKLMNSPAGSTFTSPPNPQDFPTYADEVDHIDLGMILRNLNDGLYRDNEPRFISDIRRVWACTMDFFPPTNIRYQLAEASKGDFELYLERLEKQRNPMKMMEERITVLERKMADVIMRLDRNEQRRVKPPLEPELMRLAEDIRTLPLEALEKLVTIAPNHFCMTALGECDINLSGLPRKEYEDIKKCIRASRRKKPKKQPAMQPITQPTVQPIVQPAAQPTPPTASEEFARSLRKGEADLIQARAMGLLDKGSSESSSSSCSSSEAEGEETHQDNIC